jgi:hypothetical protein
VPKNIHYDNILINNRISGIVVLVISERIDNEVEEGRYWVEKVYYRMID